MHVVTAKHGLPNVTHSGIYHQGYSLFDFLKIKSTLLKKINSGSFLVIQRIKDPGCNSGGSYSSGLIPGSFCMSQVQPKRKKKNELDINAINGHHYLCQRETATGKV